MRPKWCVLAASETTLFVFCSDYQNVVLLVDATGLNLTYKDLIKKIVCSPGNNKCMIQRSESCPDTATLKKFLDQELKEQKDDDCQWDTMDRATLTAITATYGK